MSEQPPDRSTHRSIPVTARPSADQEASSPSTTISQSTNIPDPSSGDPAEHRVTVFAAVGGQPFFDRLVERFYRGVEADDVLLPLYPEPEDLGPARERLALFLGQYWGGPPAYSELRGHPRLRMRHTPYAIGIRERDHWVASMDAALRESIPETPLDEQLRSDVEQRMREYFAMAADHLVNQPG